MLRPTQLLILVGLVGLLTFISPSIIRSAIAADQFPPSRSDQVSGNQRSIYYTWSDWPWTDEQPVAEALCVGKVLVLDSRDSLAIKGARR